MSDPMSEEWFKNVYLPQQAQVPYALNIGEDDGVITTWDYVKEDIADREQMGALKYGKYLTPSTSEDMLNHLYNELLDAVVYTKTLMLQRNKPYDPNL